MGIWIARPALSGSEAAMWQRLASWAQSARRDVGGRLYLTTTMTSITSATGPDHRGPPPRPYADLHRVEILRRSYTAEILRRAFRHL